jgi:glycosyltransferase involved in cell wall biosynthesis
MRVYVDHTHLGRPITGIERIALELFSPEALAPFSVVPITAHGIAGMVAAQTLALPARMAATKSAILLCPGFPPSPLLWPFADRVIPYIHDLFLLTRPNDLNLRAKLYMVEPFRLAVRHYRRFFVNSECTKKSLSQFCRRDAEITLYRPHIRNVFDLYAGLRSQRETHPRRLRLVALGTVEPRKHLVAAADLVRAFSQRDFGDLTLDIIGRRGWGEDWAKLEAAPGVTLHGYQPSQRVREIVAAADAFISTSYEEGCGVPLLEAQYAGLPVIAPDRPIFREVLGDTGIFIDTENPAAGADRVAAAFSQPGWRAAHAALATQNLDRWNALADNDHDVVIDLLFGMAEAIDGRPPRSTHPLSDPARATARDAA